MVPINSSFFVSRADNHTNPIHHDDVGCTEQNEDRENQSGSGHFIFAERSYPPMTGGWAVVGIAVVGVNGHSVRRPFRREWGHGATGSVGFLLVPFRHTRHNSH